MAIPLSEYIAIKNKYCIGYFGLDKSLIKDILQARKEIEKVFPELEVYITCKNEMGETVRGHKDIILESKIDYFRGRVAYFRNLEKKEDLIEILNEANISLTA